MKNITLTCLTFCWVSASVQTVQAMNLKDAIKNKLVKANVRWMSNSDEQGCSDRYGKHIGIELKNISQRNVDIDIPCGFVFFPADSSKQNMLITEQMAYTLKPGEIQTKYTYAYCCEAHDGGPNENEVYKPGRMAKEALVKLADFIREKKYQDYGAQRAIWAVSDNNPIEDIYADSAQEASELIHFTGNLKGYRPAMLDSLSAKVISKHKKVETTIHCSVPFDNDTYVWAMVEDLNNVNYKTVVTKQAVSKGTFERNFSFSSIDYPSGDYVLRIYSTDKSVVEMPFRLDK
jgi:hypothetical protein